MCSTVLILLKQSIYVVSGLQAYCQWTKKRGGSNIACPVPSARRLRALQDNSRWVSTNTVLLLLNPSSTWSIMMLSHPGFYHTHRKIAAHILPTFWT